MFETYLHSTNASHGLRDTVSKAAKRHVNESFTAPQSREQALERILQQESNLNAQIEALREGTSAQKEGHDAANEFAITEKPGNSIALAPAPPSLTPQERKHQKKAAEQEAWIQRLTGTKATDSAVSNHTRAKENASAKSISTFPCWPFQLGKCNDGDACKFKHVRVPTFVPKPCHYYQMGRCTDGDACQYSHVRNPNFERKRHDQACRYSHGQQVIEDCKEAAYSSEDESECVEPEEQTGGRSGFVFTKQQLAEATDFAKIATKHQTRRGTRSKRTNGTKGLPPKPTHVPLLNAQAAARAVVPRTPANANFKFIATSSNPLPPHLKKLQDLKAAKNSAQTNPCADTPAFESRLPNVTDAGRSVWSSNDRMSTSDPASFEREEDDLYSLTPPRNPSVHSQTPAIASTNTYALLEMASDDIKEPKRDPQTAGDQQDNARGVASTVHETITRESCEVAVELRQEEQERLERERQERLKARLASLESNTDYESWQRGATNTPPRRPAFEQLLQTDDDSQGRYLLDQREHEGEPASFIDESASCTKLANRAMTIEELKSFVQSSKQRNVDRRHDLLPGSLIAKIERANRIISGKEDSLLSRNSSRAERPGKEEKSSGHFGGVSSRGWERYDEMPNAVESSDSEDESNQDASAHIGQDDEGGDGVVEGTDRDSAQAPALHPRAMEPLLSDPAQNLSDNVEPSPGNEGSETMNVKTRTPRVPLLSLQPNTDPRPSSRSRERMSVFKQMVDGSQGNVRGSNGSNTSSVDHHEDDLRGLDFSIGLQVESPATQPACAPQAPTAKASLQATVLPFVPSVQSASNGTQTKASTTSASMPTPVASNTMHMGHHPQTSFQYPAMETTPAVASTTTQPLIYPNLMEVEQYSTDTIRQLPVQHGNAYDIMNYTHLVVNTPTNAAFRSTSGYGTAYENHYDTLMPNWDAGMFQNQASAPYQQFGNHNYTNSADLQLSPFQHAQLSAPAAAVQTPVKSKSTSKAAAITKPPRVQYNEEYPSLPSKKSVDPEPKLLPPPGFRGSHRADQSTFDALLSKGADAVGAKVEKTTEVATPTPFDALLSFADGVNDGASTNPDNIKRDSVVDVGTDDSETGPKAIQKKRKQARAALTKAWEEREVIRKRVVGTYTLDGARALEYATKTYNDKRMELAGYMASGELREEDKKMFPYVSSSDLSVPKLRPADAQRSAA